MGRQKKVSTKEISEIEKWLKSQTQARRDQGKRVWDPDLDTVCPWSIYDEKLNKDQKKSRVIKRNIKFFYTTEKEANKAGNPKQTWQRLPKRFYSAYIKNNRELENLCILLNGLDPAEYRAGLRYRAQTAYLPKDVIINFVNDTKAEFLNDDKKDITNRLNNFIANGLNWFQKRTHKVYEWKRHEEKWGHCLINMADNIKDNERIFDEGELRSKNTIIRTVWMMNRFMKYLHKQYPNRYPLFEFDPISKGQFKALFKKRKSLGLTDERSEITEFEWKRIHKKLKDHSQLKILQLCWEFGLRRSEALALSESSMFEESLSIDKQLKLLDPLTNAKITKDPKSIAGKRHIPYDASRSQLNPTEIFEIITSAEPISPDRATKEWRLLVDELDMSFCIHELRHSYAHFLVKSIGGKAERQFSLKDCMNILGHESIETTNHYIKSPVRYSKKKFDITKAKEKEDKKEKKSA